MRHSLRYLFLRAVCVVAAIGAPFGTALAAETVTVAALRFVSSGPIFIAKEKGYFAAEGLEVTLKFFDAAQPVAVAIASGDADFGATGFTAGLFNIRNCFACFKYVAANGLVCPAIVLGEFW